RAVAALRAGLQRRGGGGRAPAHVGVDPGAVAPRAKAISVGSGAVMIHWLARWSLSRRLDEGDAPGPMLRRHIDGCEACRAYERRLGAVDAALRQQVMRAPSPAPVAAAAGSRLAVTGFAAAAMAAVAYLVVAV